MWVLGFERLTRLYRQSVSQSRCTPQSGSECLSCGIAQVAADTPTNTVSMLSCTKWQARTLWHG